MEELKKIILGLSADVWGAFSVCKETHKVNVDTGVTAGHCLLLRNGVKLQLNIDTGVSYENFPCVFT